MSIKLLYSKYKLLWYKTRILVSLIFNVGISIVSCPPILKHQKNISTMAEQNAGARRQAMGLIATPPPGASSRWVGRGRCRRICLHSLNRLRKKIIYWGIYFILFFISSESIVSKTINYRPPCVPQRLRVLFYPSPVTPSCFWLVVACSLSPGGDARPRRILFFSFSVDQFDSWSDVTAFPCMFLPCCTSSPTPPLSPKPNLFDCCMFLVKRRSPTAEAPCLSLSIFVD